LIDFITCLPRPPFEVTHQYFEAPANFKAKPMHPHKVVVDTIGRESRLQIVPRFREGIGKPSHPEAAQSPSRTNPTPHHSRPAMSLVLRASLACVFA